MSSRAPLCSNLSFHSFDRESQANSPSRDMKLCSISAEGTAIQHCFPIAQEYLENNVFLAYYHYVLRLFLLFLVSLKSKS